MTIRRLFSTAAFERDLRRMKRQRKDLDKIAAIIELLRYDGCQGAAFGDSTIKELEHDRGRNILLL